MSARDQDTKVVVRAKYGIDRAIIGNVIPEVTHRRFIKRRDPDRINAQRLEVIELGIDTGKITRSIPVTVKKAPRIDLVDNCSSPPFALHGLVGSAKTGAVNGGNGGGAKGRRGHGAE